MQDLDDDFANDAIEEDGEGEGLRQRLEGLIPDLVRRTMWAGIGAVLSSEEGIRKMAQDFSLPKDVANSLIAHAQNSKDELLRIIGNEVRRFLENLNLHEELQRLLTSLSFEIKTEVRFIPNDARPKTSTKVKIKHNKSDADEQD